ncbi:trans-aconitate 2-methyltransferase [Actinoplanes sp. N902-109]|uniref:class I SAM-dependent methyltransferase n=1 Tax=Actinoplanes sp. (strain N902-109) TaxID=649831 RepID=UPI0003294152|nr:class I SAM-dependent methyltransferase [Actinoplanes sp. N902-109]AGL14325.1 type 12 methyltransferase [Actinoplanes sp. N902-109]
MAHDDAHWIAYNAGQGGRPVRPLLLTALEQAGPGRTAIDLGCGAGVETRALLAAGWRVHAIDGSPETEALVKRTVGGVHPRLTVSVRHFAELTELPPADLIHAGYSLPYQPPESFRRVWQLMLAALRPGGLLAVNLFGANDEWAGTPGETYLTLEAVRDLVAGLEIRSWQEEDAVGPAYSGSKHWHVFDIVAAKL